MKLAYLSDIFGKVTELNLQLEGTDKHLPHLADKTSAFTQNLGMWGRRLDQGNTDSFENLNEFAENSDSMSEGAHLFPEMILSKVMPAHCSSAEED